MTDTAEGLHPDAGPTGGDPFVTQVLWLVGAVGGKEELVRRSGRLVSLRTLDNWAAGTYPRNKITGAVREVDAWAAGNVPGYPGAGAPRLIDACGPPRTTGNPASAAGPSTVDRVAAVDPVPPRHRWRRLFWVVPLVVALIAAAVVTTIVLTRDDTLQPLPTSADGPPLPETTGSIGANTFADPRTLIDNAQPIPANTTVQVRCRFYAPSIPSVTPDGFWYLIDSDEWAGRWSPANSFMNGDVPGQPTLHNTDFAVPLCR
jgi:hypothetical protein